MIWFRPGWDIPSGPALPERETCERLPEAVEWCSLCESPARYWRECRDCGGEGEVCVGESGTLYSVEPVADYVGCPECAGLGGWLFCTDCKEEWA